MESAEVVVVGAGIMGAATAWALKRDGVQPLVLEQFEPGHANGSSHGHSRIFRFAYDDPFHVRLAQQALPLWEELDPSLLTITGGIDFGPASYLDTSAAAMRSCGAAADILSAAEVRERFPGVDYGSEPALYSPDTGVLAASECLPAFLAGVDVRSGVTVEKIVGTTVHTSEGAFGAQRVVVAAGAWTGPLLGLSMLQPSQEQVFYFDGGEELPVVIDRGPIMRYFVPGSEGGSKAGEHGTGRRVSADERTFDVDPLAQARVSEWIYESFPSVSPEPVYAETCLYTLTPDEQFLIDVRDDVVFASPCSGHGFKFAPLIGEALAALALGSPPPFDISPYSLSRFG